MLRFAVSATFTANPLERVFSFWAQQLGWAAETVFAPYGRLHESVVDPASVLGTNASGINIVLIRWEDLGAPAARAANARVLLDDLTARRFAVPSIVSLAPSPDLPEWLIAEVRDLCRDAVLPDDVDALYPAGAVFSEQGDRLGHVPFTDAYFAAWGTMLIRRAHRILAPPLKVIVTDADDTIWQGVCGEDGPGGIRLTPGRKFLQELLRSQSEGGPLLALASKNNPEDVAAAFAAHPEFPLSLDRFAASRVAWTEKSASLEELARELNLGLSSFALLDDSPKECAAVAASHAEVAVLPIPHDDSAIEPFLRHIWLFDQGPVTDEDRKRAESYRGVAEFESARGGAASLEEFYRSLQLHVDLHPVREDEWARAAQLTQRTNQFNCTTIRRTEPELRAVRDRGATVWAACVTDRFGDYGFTGLAVCQADSGVLVIETFLLSCRVLGRGVEHEIVRRLAKFARENHCDRVRIRFSPTLANEPARRFLASLRGGGHLPDGQENGAERYWEAPADEFVDLPFAPGEKEAGETKSREVKASETTRSAGTTTQRQFRDYARIARDLGSADKIVEAMRGHWTPPPDAVNWTETERRLAALWAELLRTPDIQPASNFFDLGGHSLLAVLLLTRIHEVFDAEVSIDAVYDAGVTLASLAARIDAAKHMDPSEEEYAALVAEIESLSEEEVQALLHERDGIQ